MFSFPIDRICGQSGKLILNNDKIACFPVEYIKFMHCRPAYPRLRAFRVPAYPFLCTSGTRSSPNSPYIRRSRHTFRASFVSRYTRRRRKAIGRRLPESRNPRFPRVPPAFPAAKPTATAKGVFLFGSFNSLRPSVNADSRIQKLIFFILNIQ